MMARFSICKEAIFFGTECSEGFPRSARGVVAMCRTPASCNQVCPMISRLHLIVRSLLICAAAVSLAGAVESDSPQPEEVVPWNESFTMAISSQERVFALYHGTSYLVLSPADAGNPKLLLGQKDVVITAKFVRAGVADSRQQIHLSSFPEVIAEGDTGLFATRLEGDNLFFFGSLVTPVIGKGRFTITSVEAAPSDAQIIAAQLAGIPTADYTARFKAANRIRERATSQPNKEFWLAASDHVIAQIIDDATATATATKDVALLNQAITWCIEILHDPTKAGRIASLPWIKNTAEADTIAKRLRHLGMEMYKDQWQPRAEALAKEFEDRFAEISWKDADAYYRLGRWADLHGEDLPRTKDRSYRCYEAGFRANPNHQGIRNELGLPNIVRGDGTQMQTNADFLHVETGTLIPAPRNWKRGDTVEGDFTWVDPQSETSYLSASIIQTPENPSLEGLWQNIEGALRSRPEFTVLEQDDPTFPQGLARRFRFSFREGRYLRQHELILALNPTAQVAVRLDAGFADDEQAIIHQVLLSTFDRLVIPNQGPTPTVK